MEETVTVIRLGVPELLQRTLRSTNAIESANEKVRLASRNVKRWQNGEQVLRWAAAGFLGSGEQISYRERLSSNPDAHENTTPMCASRATPGRIIHDCVN
jgi:uncharacterized protein VirK/YbjX